MSPAQRERLQAAAKFVGARLQQDWLPDAIIAGLVAAHGGHERSDRLSVAGVVATCGPGVSRAGLLDNWRRNATVRLAREPA